ncbi:mitochondrial processing peptidase [Moniliophthora roreri]|uniref:Alpha-MPP n=1 Tax=Moniliophthora roreri TaxID=221103 RepID=A0A0W0F1K4_MONRR|nr:mitochondrial processing peptidase [Moniliophthora roreri]
MHKASRSLARGIAKNATRNLNVNNTKNSQVQITTLPNKIRVATDSTPGHFTSVGLYVDAGTRYETAETSGVSHFLDRMAFKSTHNRTEEEMASAMHAMGGQIMCASSRESIMYQSSHFSKATPLALELIAETVQNASFLPEEIEAQRDAAYYELRELAAKPEMILPEVVHAVGFNYTGLGNPLLPPEDRIDLIDSALLRKTMKHWYTPERLVIAGAGIHHQELVELVDKYFSSLKVTPSLTAPSRLNPTHPIPSNLLSHSNGQSVKKTLSRAASYLFPNSSVDVPEVLAASTYTGGHQFIHDPEGEFDHLYIGYEGVGIHDEDVYTLATMQVLLGGGGSFSAGGPGKGMYSRLYTHILNLFPQVDHCASFHHIYTDSSLFGLFASFMPVVNGTKGGNTPTQILPHLVHQLSLLMYTTIPEIELSRAKNQLMSSLMMAVESRAIQVEDLGRQVLVHDRPVPITEMTDKIAQVTADDIRRVATRIFGPQSGNKATVVCQGHEDVKDYHSIFKKYGLSS